MNHFNWTKRGRNATTETVDITLSPVCAPMIIPLLRQAYEIPFLRGTLSVDAEGDTHLNMELSSDEAQQLKSALMLAYTKVSGHNTEN